MVCGMDTYFIFILILGYVVLPPIEVLLSGPVRRSRRSNLGLVVPVMITAGVATIVATGVTIWGADHGVGLLHWAGVTGPVAAVLAFVALDVVAYADHLMRHRFGRLWRLHRPHHTDTDVDVTTSLRNHPLEVASIVLVSAAASVVIGAPAWVYALSGTVTTAFGIWLHMRVALPGRFEHAVSRMFQTPGMHRAHHSPGRHQTDSNYGVVFSVWDRAFGTFSAPDPLCETGLDTADLADRQSVRAMLADPWRPTSPIQVLAAIRDGHLNDDVSSFAVSAETAIVIR